jgi:hypothetical protein
MNPTRPRAGSLEDILQYELNFQNQVNEKFPENRETNQVQIQSETPTAPPNTPRTDYHQEDLISHCNTDNRLE